MTNLEFIIVSFFTLASWGMIYLFLNQQEKNKKEQKELNYLENEK